jgi:hypothetical protein
MALLLKAKSEKQTPEIQLRNSPEFLNALIKEFGLFVTEAIFF